MTATGSHHATSARGGRSPVRRASIVATAVMALAVMAIQAPAPAGPEDRKPIITERPPGVATAAMVQPDREGAVTPAEPFTWTGQLLPGANTAYDAASGEPCGDTPESMCDVTLLNVDVPPAFWDEFSGGVRVTLTDYFPVPTSDFDLYIYESDAEGTRGNLVASSPNLPGEDEDTTIPEASGYYLIQVVYFAVAPASQYTGTATFSTRYKNPADVDTPPGLQEFLASDPSKGFLSHSEMHVAQNPLDPGMLVAASKFYNKDPDSLAEYEFKIGSYASFDGGGTWSDLGQVNICPQDQAPPESWPLENTCYPTDNPSQEGTGAEDGEGGTDYGEEYIVSDPWVHFDDEGNAYLMVLDSPPFPEGAGNGWGMSFHRWESVSPADVASGNTWSDRIVINAYATPDEQQNFLDDKNTFAVNNAGEDGDGETGIMIACWGQNVDPLIKQQTVCERSTDGGQTWPGAPQPISPPSQQLVIGVHVVADTQNPNTFYAMWNHYAPGIAGEQEEMWVSRTTDGGVTWGPPNLAFRFRGIPLTYPGQSFRNLTIPIMGVGTDSTLYATYAEYRPAPNPDTDEDGLQADIMFTTSSNGGLTWSTPTKVNQDDSNADQFQPYIAVTEAGQLNVIYFDRRLDFRAPAGDPPTNPNNFFIDTWLSRSNDAGATWTDTRLSHDSWDPSINPPISGSGEFIGDYQGLVADDCAAIPFVNDTHLANPASRDPGFDDSLPRSEYQEAFSWWVPNTADFGGAGAELPEGCEPPDPEPPELECPGLGEVQGTHVVGTDERDILVGTPGDDVICGGDGNDVLRGLGGDDRLFGERGADRLSGGAGNDDLVGQQHRDVLRGGPGDDRMRAGPGGDVVRGGPGDDIGRGWRGRDTLFGSGGDDLLHGGQGPDRLFGGSQDDRLAGAKGNDDLNGGGGTDRCSGGPGRDRTSNCEAGRD